MSCLHQLLVDTIIHEPNHHQSKFIKPFDVNLREFLVFVVTSLVKVRASINYSCLNKNLKVWNKLMIEKQRRMIIVLLDKNIN